MNFMKNNPNSYYDQINSKFNKKDREIEDTCKINSKTHKKQLNINKQESNEKQFLIFRKNSKTKMINCT